MIVPYAPDDPLPQQLQFWPKRWDRFARPQCSTFLLTAVFGSNIKQSQCTQA